MFSRLLRTVVAALPLISTALGFGLVESGNNYVVTTNGGLVFTVDKTSGDITSLVFNGVEVQSSSKHSHIASGIGATCTWVQGGNSNNYILITCSTSTIRHYYMARYTDPAVHMATYTSAEPDVGELRYIARLRHSVLASGYTAATTAGTSGAIEGSDVYLVNGQTRSKFYSSRQFVDDAIAGPAYGGGVYAWMVKPDMTSFELSSGGPFFRDIDNQNGDTDNEIYFYMNSGHVQTESYRQGFHGPYALWFTTGSTPATYDSFAIWDQFASSLSGYTAKASRGRVTGTATGFPSGDASYIMVGWSNSAAQYWVRTSTSGAFTSPYMKPGTYTMTLYRWELAIGTSSVTVTAGGTVSKSIASSESIPSYIWKIGALDGTPRGFRNADKIETMHPSDTRMSSWAGITHTVGSSADSSFPMAIWKAVGGVTINFNLTSSQIGARTLVIATTLSFAGGRPGVVVNSWTGATPAAPTKIDSRGVTRGSWRGYNERYTWSVPSGTLVSGSNSLTITVASGSDGDVYLSPNFIFDSVYLY
ncbi:polysaccharide lyase family 4 protein [Auriculariales sp. MPI-PUGE-AT-0066]|nr:polysaccharide lyase family 4 protein [Auriculariales sp. MPI-PUGE-AT-0066]